MNVAAVTTGKECSPEKIVFYLDGELEAGEEAMLERHLVGCRSCRAELNTQKQMFSLLDSAFVGKAEIELPENFAKVVAVRAESGVKGLRSKDERFRATFLCALLFLIVIAGLGTETETIFASLKKIGEQIMTVLNFVWHPTYDLVVGMTVILRSVANQPKFNSVILWALGVSLLVGSAVFLPRCLSLSRRS